MNLLLVSIVILDATLTVSNLCDALDKVSEWDTLGRHLNVPESKRRAIKRQCSNDSDRKHAVIVEFINNHPAPSWRIVTEFLHKAQFKGSDGKYQYGKYNETLQIVTQEYITNGKKMSSYKLTCTLKVAG